ncbi:TlpA disulfide reductase family protein [uncultured Algimonas sp.]|uniref:TlpA family protein disulfide reductase n=1 Tax=uncultured Algimonas sp. TaxID=1547920 RepID=UPI002610F90F|nr:TlpA disulfide reductase family protein [uncultured Algimonas sp.]
MLSHSVLSLANAIKLMIFGGLLTFAFAGVKACQQPEGALDRFAVGSLGKLTSLDAPPTQPGLTFVTPDGEIMLADYRGKVVLVNAWATWCPPCVAEMPSLDELQRLRGGDDFAVVPVSLDRTMEEAADFYDRTGLTDLPLVHDGSFAINAQLELPGLPTSVIYDEHGRELARLPGEADWASEEALALIDHLTGR